MRLFCTILTLAFLTAALSPVQAQDRVVNDLSSGALLGEIASTPQLQETFARQDSVLAQASDEIGLTSSQYAQVRRAVASGTARYVELPRHIDAMSGLRRGHVFVVHNIRIPSGVYGWEVDVNEPNDVMQVYVPNRCGNISYVRVHRTQVMAMAPVHHVLPAQRVAAAIPIPSPVTIETPAPLPSVVALAAPEAVAATHHLALIPWLIGGLIGGILVSHGGGGGFTSGPTPIPIHTICPPSPKP